MSKTAILNPRARRLAALAALAALLLGGVATSCDQGGNGLYQGGSDSAPGWR